MYHIFSFLQGCLKTFKKQKLGKIQSLIDFKCILPSFRYSTVLPDFFSLSAALLACNSFFFPAVVFPEFSSCFCKQNSYIEYHCTQGDFPQIFPIFPNTVPSRDFDMKIKAIHLKLSKQISFVQSTLYSYLWVIKCHKNQFLRQYTHSLKWPFQKFT